MDAARLDAYLADCRALTLDEIRLIVPTDARSRAVLYDLAMDYPMRQAKALRPALCIATCRAFGGSLEAVLRSAAVLELYHNAFLIHDDVEDGSELRRDRPTLHRTHGAPIAVNVGDAMLALALQPLLDNMRLIGMGKALRVLQVVARMARESAEGQAIELHWIRDGSWRLSDSDYLRMVYKKTSWYSFITPMLVGGIVAGAPASQLTRLRKLAALLGIAFQIKDDILNLRSEGGSYGKEAAGDLWEGKHTLILMHAIRNASASERDRARAILAKPRPALGSATDARDSLGDLLDRLVAEGELSAAVRTRIENVLASTVDTARPTKTAEEIDFLMRIIERSDSLDYAANISQRFANQARQHLDDATGLHPSTHLDFIHGLIDFVVDRNH